MATSPRVRRQIEACSRSSAQRRRAPPAAGRADRLRPRPRGRADGRRARATRAAAPSCSAPCCSATWRATSRSTASSRPCCVSLARGEVDALAAARAAHAAGPGLQPWPHRTRDSACRPRRRERAHDGLAAARSPRRRIGYDFYQAMRRLEARAPAAAAAGRGAAARRRAGARRASRPSSPSRRRRCTALELRARLRRRALMPALLRPARPQRPAAAAPDRATCASARSTTATRRCSASSTCSTHRFALLFYRAWAQAQPARRPGPAGQRRRFGAASARWSASALPSLQRPRCRWPTRRKLHFAGRLARQVRNADGLLAWCRAQFDVPVRVEQWCGHWMPLAARRAHAACGAPRRRRRLGRGAVLGGSVWDVQHGSASSSGRCALRALSALPARRRRAGPRCRRMVRQ